MLETEYRGVLRRAGAAAVREAVRQCRRSGAWTVQTRMKSRVGETEIAVGLSGPREGSRHGAVDVLGLWDMAGQSVEQGRAPGERSRHSRVSEETSGISAGHGGAIENLCERSLGRRQAPAVARRGPGGLAERWPVPSLNAVRNVKGTEEREIHQGSSTQLPSRQPHAPKFSARSVLPTREYFSASQLAKMNVRIGIQPLARRAANARTTSCVEEVQEIGSPAPAT